MWTSLEQPLGLALKASTFSQALESKRSMENLRSPMYSNTMKFPSSNEWSFANSFHPRSKNTPSFSSDTTSTFHMWPLGPFIEQVHGKFRSSICLMNAGEIPCRYIRLKKNHNNNSNLGFITLFSQIWADLYVPDGGSRDQGGRPWRNEEIQFVGRSPLPSTTKSQISYSS